MFEINKTNIQKEWFFDRIPVQKKFSVLIYKLGLQIQNQEDTINNYFVLQGEQNKEQMLVYVPRKGFLKNWYSALKPQNLTNYCDISFSIFKENKRSWTILNIQKEIRQDDM